jgi:hypothetical protein
MMAMADGNRDSDGQWQRRWQWLTMTVIAMATETATASAMAMATLMATMTITTTDTWEGCLFRCRQCAALWQGRSLASPPRAQRKVHCPALHHLGAIAKSVCSISRGRDPESSPWIRFFYYFFQLPVQFTK